MPKGGCNEKRGTDHTEHGKICGSQEQTFRGRDSIQNQIVDSGGLGRTIGARTNLLGRAGEHTEFSTQYYIYVPKEYEQRARHVINEK